LAVTGDEEGEIETTRVEPSPRPGHALLAARHSLQHSEPIEALPIYPP
jgi:hypothetical protein